MISLHCIKCHKVCYTAYTKAKDEGCPYCGGPLESKEINETEES